MSTDSDKLDTIINMLTKLTVQIQDLESNNHSLNEKMQNLEIKLENIDKETKDILEGTGKMTDHLNVVNTIYDNVRKPITNITKMFLGKDSQLVLPDRKAIEYKNDFQDAKIEDITEEEFHDSLQNEVPEDDCEKFY